MGFNIVFIFRTMKKSDPVIFLETSFMKPTTVFPLLFFPLLCEAQYTYKNLRIDIPEKSIDMNKYTYGNLRLYPVMAKDNFERIFKDIGTYTSLQEAVHRKKIKISEKPTGGSVGDLTIQNLSSDTIILICGDVIKGGQQDRIVKEDLVLAPKSGKKNLKVFCVESGRWSPTRNESRSQPLSQSAPNTATPEFNSYFSKGSLGLRKVVEKEDDQNKVWSKVEEVNKKNNTQTATRTYTAIHTSDTLQKNLNAYLQFFKGKFTDPRIIGLVVVTGNKVIGCDLFASHTLFNGQLPSLLHSYATEAILEGKPVLASAATVKSYIDPLLKDEVSQNQILKKKGTAFINNGKKLRVSSFD